MKSDAVALPPPGGPLKGIRKYLRVFGMGWQEQMEYRVNNFAESLIGIVSFAVMFFLWSNVYAANHGNPVGGMTLREMLTYLLVAKFWTWVQDPTWEVDSMLSEDIKNGGLNRILVRPLSDRIYRLCLFLSHKSLYGLLRIGPMIAVIVLLPSLFALPVNANYLLLPLVAVMSLLLQFSFSYAFTLLAFWMLSIGGLLFLKRIVIAFLSGAWIPLTLFPASVTAVFMAMPFQYFAFFPSQVALNRIGTPGILAGCLVMAAWIAGFWLLGSFLWKRGLRRYTASGI